MSDLRLLTYEILIIRVLIKPSSKEGCGVYIPPARKMDHMQLLCAFPVSKQQNYQGLNDADVTDGQIYGGSEVGSLKIE